MISQLLLTQEKQCAAEHFGPWAIEPKFFEQAVARYNAGNLQPINRDGEKPDDPGFEMAGDVAVIHLTGAMTKRPSSFAGASTLVTRKALRAAAADSRAESILLVIDSPGGSVAGVGELANDIREVNADTTHGKPVDAYIDDLGASAAYWVASQCRRVAANDTALIGSIGVFTMLTDTSDAAQQEGVKVHLINTGPNKGAFSGTGVPIPGHKLDAVQREIDSIFGRFEEDVMAGRGLTRAQFDKVADGSVFIARQAKTMGLIDKVQPLNAAIRETIVLNQEPNQQFGVNQAPRMEGNTMSTTRTPIQMEGLYDAINKAKKVVNSLSASVDVRHAARSDVRAALSQAGFDSAEEFAKHEYRNDANIQQRYISEEVYSAVRRREILGGRSDNN